MKWARGEHGKRKWAYRCERFVEEAYGTRGRFPDAATAARRLSPLNRTPVTTARRGALVYFAPNAANRWHGHVGLSLGNGKIISALDRVEITDVPASPYWRSQYLGWTFPPSDWRGRLPPPPAPTGPLTGSAVEITAPAIGQVVAGEIELAATAFQVGGVEFDAYYLSDPSNTATLGWHRLGRATNDGDAWTLTWRTMTVPDQGDDDLGTVNVAAVALNLAGQRTHTLDYRRIAIDNHPQPPPGPTPTPTPTPTNPALHPEQSDSDGTPTFRNYHSAADPGPRIAALQWVNVSCKFFDPTIPSVQPEGYWYRIADAPWNDQYYGAANSFFNGEPHRDIDLSVPDC